MVETRHKDRCRAIITLSKLFTLFVLRQTQPPIPPGRLSSSYRVILAAKNSELLPENIAGEGHAAGNVISSAAGAYDSNSSTHVIIIIFIIRIVALSILHDHQPLSRPLVQ